MFEWSLRWFISTNNSNWIISFLVKYTVGQLNTYKLNNFIESLSAVVISHVTISMSSAIVNEMILVCSLLLLALHKACTTKSMFDRFVKP